MINSSGETAAAYDYDEFGETTVMAGQSFDNEICYTGQVYDQNTGLYYYNARFYDPEDGRFLTQDTYRGENMEPETLHLYAYCANNPVNYVDPSGHKWVSNSVTKRYYSTVPDAGHQVWRVRAFLSVEYSKNKSKNKTIKKMTFTAIGDKHTNCGNGTCRFVNVKIYKKNKLWKTIKGISKVVKPGDGVILGSSSCCYTDKKIDKDYSVGKKKIKVKSKLVFTPPADANIAGGMNLEPTVSFS